MSGINWREAALVALFVSLLFGSLLARPYLPASYREVMTLVFQGATLAVAVVLIVRWFIRRRRL